MSEMTTETGKSRAHDKTPGKKMPKILKRAALGTVAFLATLEGAGATATELTDNVPFLNNPAYTAQSGPLQKLGYDLSHPLDWYDNLFHQEIVVPPTFDNKAKNAIIKVGVNTEFVDTEDLTKIKENIIKPLHEQENGLPTLPTFMLLNPILSEEGDIISISKLTMPEGIDTSTGKVIEPQYIGAYKLNVANKDREIMPGIIDPKATSIEVFRKSPIVLDGKEYFGGVTILITREDGSKYAVGFRAPEDVRSLVPLPILDGAPFFKDTKDLLSKKGLPITGTTHIMKTGIDDSRINFGVSRISSGSSVTGIFFSDIQLFESPNGKVLSLPR